MPPPKAFRPQTLCPVLGGKINKNCYADFKGRRIYGCSENCVPMITKDAERLIKLLEVDGVGLQLVPGYGDTIDLAVSINVGDSSIAYDIKCSHHFLRTFVFTQLTPQQITAQLQGATDEMALTLENFFHERNPLSVDGLPLRPKVKAFGLVSSASSYYIGIRLAYPMQSPPQEIRFRWTTYVPTDEWNRPLFDQLTALLTVGAEETKGVVLTGQEPEYVWQSPTGKNYKEILTVSTSSNAPPLRVPTLSIVLLIFAALFLGGFRPLSSRLPQKARWAVPIVLALMAAFTKDAFSIGVKIPFLNSFQKLDDAQATTIFETLHRNIYRAFDYQAESDVYDALNMSVSGNLLEQIYNEVYQYLVQKDKQGAVCHIQSVRILESKILGPSPLAKRAYKVHCRWRVHGTVYHWGHAHARTNEYEAIYTVGCVENAWKIVGTEVVQQNRIT